MVTSVGNRVKTRWTAAPTRLGQCPRAHVFAPFFPQIRFCQVDALVGPVGKMMAFPLKGCAGTHSISPYTLLKGEKTNKRCSGDPWLLSTKIPWSLTVHVSPFCLAPCTNAYFSQSVITDDQTQSQVTVGRFISPLGFAGSLPQAKKEEEKAS